MSDEETNAYELLEIKLEATEQEIRTAYRQRSLKVHPDRNPNNPDAARKFHELTQAYELLSDPLRRLALDAKLRLKQARNERYKHYDLKRKNMVDELEERERSLKKARVNKQKEEAARWEETEKIKDEGRRLREEKLKEMEKREQEANQAAKEEDEDDTPTLQATDTTVRVKYTISEHPSLTTAASLASLFAPFGAIDVDTVIVSLKPPKKAPHKPAKHGTALIPFKRIGDAFAAVCATRRPERGLAGIEVGWIGGVEPEILGWLRKKGHLGPPGSGISSDPQVQRPEEKAPPPQTQTRTSSSNEFSSFPSSMPDFSKPPAEPSKVGELDYESLTLMRMRQAERARLEREILEQEANES
ncbi:DnaJ-domain-containing protein [Gymnopus androsaceus JB14]|uniref:DnaJ-domain-containing protein n=1 Tax=Gymnopus androsaceus JB14 TaxID=1447944 RepID=A0A6A4HU35_9AGAR|nr:DnaJ-domain-containing protein [Gymnopus androsaceus JB14]